MFNRHVSSITVLVYYLLINHFTWLIGNQSRTNKQSDRLIYLSEDFNFEASRLKLLARTNCLSINATLFRMSLSDNDRCSVCPLHSVEDLQHFALECPLYEDIRADIVSQIEYVFSGNHMSVKFKEHSSYYKPLFMFGDYGYDTSAEMGKELDYLTKLYLVKAFNVRKIVLEN